MARKDFRGAAARLTLAADIDADDPTITTTGDASGWPTGGANPFVVEIDRGVAGTAEKILIQSRSGNTLTVAGSGRGYDGTTAQSHVAGAAVEHVIDAVTIDEANAHVNDDTRDDHPQYLTTGRHDTTTRHLAGTSLPAGVPGASAPGDTASEGASTAVSRADHRHEREDWGAVGDISNSANGDTAYAGATGKVADAGHRHAREGFGTPVASAVGDANSAGTSTNPARADHVHGREAFGSPVAVTFGGTAADGTATTVARSDHKHALATVPPLFNHQFSATGDSNVAPGSEVTVITETITPTALCAVFMWGQIAVRESGVDLNFGGYLKLLADGVVVTSPRFHSYNLGGALYISVFSTGMLAAGAHTIALAVTNDVGTTADIIVSNVELNVSRLGG